MEIKKENYFTRHEDNVIETMSFEELQNAVDYFARTLKMNNICPCEVPVYFTHDGKKYEFSKHTAIGLAMGRGCEVLVDFDDYSEIKYVAPDSRPEEGEYWNSRGTGVGYDGTPDCSGFVVSKLAGERLRRMVRLVLEKDETESYLDFREREPNWIQFKFNGKEFDVEKLDEMARANNNILTIEILKQCKVTEEDSQKESNNQ